MNDHRPVPGAGERCRSCGEPLARYGGALQHKRGRKPNNWANEPGRAVNWRGPRRALGVEEQLEIQRQLAIARLERRSRRTVGDLARRYGVSSRTIYRYVDTVPVPAGLETLRVRLGEWAEERDIALTADDLVTLLAVVARHRDRAAEAVA